MERAPQARRLEPARSYLLRLSVTDRCNLRCHYCMPAAGVPTVRRADLPSLEQLVYAVEWLAETLPIDRIKLTGGEPLVRRGVTELVQRLTAISAVKEVSATTNGALLPRLAKPLAAAGMARVNVSLDTLDPERFERLTRGGRLADTLAGIAAAEAAGLVPIKINSVLLASSWREDVPALLDFALQRGLEVRFIELMRTGTEAGWTQLQFVAAGDVRAILTEDGAVPWTDSSTGPARVEVVPWRGATVRVGWITPQSDPFCGACMRLRLDAHGRLRRCLMDPAFVPLVDLLGTKSSDAVERTVRGFLAGKRPPLSMNTELPMASVGG